MSFYAERLGSCVSGVGLALVATLLAIWFKISTALTEIVVGTVAQLIFGAFIVQGGLAAKSEWISFLAGTGAIVLTFLAGAELDPKIFRTKWKESTVIGLVGFVGPFLGCTAVAHYVLHWTTRSSWLAGVALSTTSVAVVYAVMLELGFNVTDFGKAILAACFVNDLGTVIALGLIFSPFTIRTLIFVGASVAIFAVLPFLTPWFFKFYGEEFPNSKRNICYSSVRDGRIGGMVRERSCFACIHHRNGIGGYGWQRPCSDPAAPYSHLWPADTVLLHSRRVICFGARTEGRADGVRCVVFCEDDLQGGRTVPNREGIQLPA